MKMLIATQIRAVFVLSYIVLLSGCLDRREKQYFSGGQFLIGSLINDVGYDEAMVQIYNLSESGYGILYDGKCRLAQVMKDCHVDENGISSDALGLTLMVEGRESYGVSSILFGGGAKLELIEINDFGVEVSINYGDEKENILFLVSWIGCENPEPKRFFLQEKGQKL